MTYDYSDICFHRMKQTRMIFDQTSRREISFDFVSDFLSYTRRIIDVLMCTLIHHTSERNIYSIDSRLRDIMNRHKSHVEFYILMIHLRFIRVPLKRMTSREMKYVKISV